MTSLVQDQSRRRKPNRLGSSVSAPTPNANPGLPPHPPGQGTHPSPRYDPLTGDPVSFSPMTNSFITSKQLPTSKDWSPFVREGALQEDDLAFLNSPTPRPPHHPFVVGGGVQTMGPPGAAHTHWSGSGSSAMSQDDLMAIQSARLLSNKMALQDRLKNNGVGGTPAQVSSDQPGIPMILNKKPRKTKPRSRSGLIIGGFDASVEASQGFAAITSAARDLSPQRSTFKDPNGERASIAVPPSNDKTIRLNDVEFVSTTAGAKEVVVVGGLHESVSHYYSTICILTCQ